ncbi:MAG: hypothetical protein AB1758_16960 [Candidatus Eremiobacterota bacterium]
MQISVQPTATFQGRALAASGAAPTPSPAQEAYAGAAESERPPSRAELLAFQAVHTAYENRGWLALGSGVAGVAATALTGNPLWLVAGAGLALGFSQW